MDNGSEEEEKKRQYNSESAINALPAICADCGRLCSGVYLQLIDTQEANEKMKLYDLPVIGEYFVRPAPSEDDMDKKPVEDVKPDKDKDVNKDDKDKKESKKIVITKEEIEKQMKQREAEEKKRVSKLARLYNQMKPKDAAKAMDGLDDDMCIAILQRMDEAVVAKIMTEFNEDKTARITRIMYAGTQKEVNTEEDIRKMLEEKAQKEGQSEPEQQ